MEFVHKEDFIKQIEDHINQCRNDWNEITIKPEQLRK